jgi:putative DNA primase/helicase
MLDFNDTSPPGETGRRNVNDSERDEIRTELIARMESVLTTMFPAGKKRRGKFLIGDILGSPGDSLEVVLEGEKAGLWTDRATGDGGDIFALIAAYLGANVHRLSPGARRGCRSARSFAISAGAQRQEGSAG